MLEPGYAWVINLADRMQNFAHRTNARTASVVIVEDMEPPAAVNVAPATDDTYAATDGEIEHDGRPVTVNDEPDVETLTIASTLRSKPGDRPTAETLTGEVFGQFGKLRRIGATQLTFS